MLPEDKVSSLSFNMVILSLLFARHNSTQSSYVITLWSMSTSTDVVINSLSLDDTSDSTQKVQNYLKINNMHQGLQN